MQTMRRRIAALGLVALLATGVFGIAERHVGAAQQSYASESRSGFNDEYIFATTRAVNDMQDVNPALKLTLFPATIVLDTAFLPFAVIAGFVV